MLHKFLRANKIAVIMFFAILLLLFFVYLCGSAQEKLPDKQEQANISACINNNYDTGRII